VPDLAFVRLVHITCASLSIMGFVVRGALGILAGIDYRRGIWRWLPHANDTVLFTAALILAAGTGQAPWERPWLGIKLVAVLAYIVAGKFALDPRLERTWRLLAFAAGLACFALVVWIALNRGRFG
jgi:uncharacterized membrane protein SirB2